VLGHEGAGVVEAVGANVTTVKEGDHVVLSTLGNCGACQYCDSGHPTMCRSTFGLRPQPFTWRGAPALLVRERIGLLGAHCREGQPVCADPSGTCHWRRRR